MDLLESLGLVWEEATGSPFDAGEVGQATFAFAEKNPRRCAFLPSSYVYVFLLMTTTRFLFLVFICIYFVVYNWPLLTIIIYLFCCLIYQVQDLSGDIADHLLQEMEMEARSKEVKNPDDWFLAFLLSFAFNLFILLLFSYFLYQVGDIFFIVD